MTTIAEVAASIDQTMRDHQCTVQNRIDVLAMYLTAVLTDAQVSALVAHLPTPHGNRQRKKA